MSAFKNQNLKTNRYKLNTNQGQALVELLVGLTIGAIVVGVVVSTVALVLKSSLQIKNFQIASSFAQELADKTRIISEAKWNDIYNLSPKGTSTNYFVIASGTGLAVIKGKEGILSNDIRNGLVGHWKFDEATGTAVYDSSGNSNQGTIISGTSTPRISANCKVGDCLNFDGADDYVNVPDSDALNFGTSSFSYGAWAKAIAIVGPDSDRFLSKRNGINTGVIGYDLAADPDSVDGWQAELSVGTIEIAAEAGSLINLNQWYFIMAVVDRTTGDLRLYVDGNRVTSVALGGLGSLSNTFPLNFGRVSSVGGDYFNGFVDDVRVYNRALSADEVKQLYDSGIFTRFFNMENVNRDTGGAIVTSGGVDDPSTQKITSRVQWAANDQTPEVKVATYITRWKNFILHQLDWVGGSGQDGPFTEPGNVFSTSTNTDSSGAPGSIKVQNF